MKNEIKINPDDNAYEISVDLNWSDLMIIKHSLIELKDIKTLKKINEKLSHLEKFLIEKDK